MTGCVAPAGPRSGTARIFDVRLPVIPGVEPVCAPLGDIAAQIVEGKGVSATLRQEKGLDINAACGQLRLKHERENR